MASVTTVSRAPANAPTPSAPVPRWGLRDAGVGFVVALLLSVIGASIVLSAGGWDTVDDAPMWATTVMQIPLWAGLAGAVVVAVRRRGSGSLRADVGFELRASDVPLGIVLGVAAQFVLSYVLMWPVLRLLDRSFDEYSEPARELADKAQASSTAGVVLFVVLAVVMAPLVEELFYRGLVHRSAVRLIGVPGGIALTALVFGVSHGQALQLLPLVTFGVVLSVLAQRTGRLGPGIVTHAAFNATTVVMLLLDDGAADALHASARLVHSLW